jgi:ferredoxin
MRIVHDPSRCNLHGQCVIAAPDIFGFDDGGALVITPPQGEALRADAEAAADVCPERALKVEDDGV